MQLLWGAKHSPTVFDFDTDFIVGELAGHGSGHNGVKEGQFGG